MTEDGRQMTEDRKKTILSPTSFESAELTENKILGVLCQLCERL